MSKGLPGIKQIIDISWKFDNKNNYYQTLLLYDHESKREQIILLKDYKFNWILSEHRYCPGINNKDSYEPCPRNSILYKDSFQLCYECEKKLGFKAAFFFGEEPNEFMKKYLSKKHLIYLAFFSPNILKVGTAANSRRKIRPIEQDALIYSYIAESNGFNIQDLEHSISKKLTITESVSSSVKFKNLGLKPNLKLAKTEINKTFFKIKETFKDSSFSSWIFEGNKIIDLSSLEDLFFPQVNVNKVPKNEILNLSGSFQGLRGRFTIFENKGVLLAIDERKIIGRFIKDYISDFTYSVKPTISSDQLSMI